MLKDPPDCTVKRLCLVEKTNTRVQSEQITASYLQDRYLQTSNYTMTQMSTRDVHLDCGFRDVTHATVIGIAG